jgi:hypothetical protein
MNTERGYAQFMNGSRVWVWMDVEGRLRGRKNTYHSQHPPSHQISSDPIAVYAKSMVALMIR